MKLTRNILVSFFSIILGNTTVYAFCSCWDSGVGAADSPSKDSPGSHCGGAIDWDTGHLSYFTCEKMCNKLWPNYTWAYVDELALNKCKKQNPTKVIAPTDEQKEAVENLFKCEIEGVQQISAFASVFAKAPGKSGPTTDKTSTPKTCKDWLKDL